MQNETMYCLHLRECFCVDSFVSKPYFKEIYYRKLQFSGNNCKINRTIYGVHYQAKEVNKYL